MLRADSALGRLVLALAARPADLPRVRRAGPGTRLIAALGTRPVPVATAPVPARHRLRSRGRWFPGLLTAWLAALTCLTAAAVLPGPWRELTPGQAQAPGPEHWRLTAAGRLGPRGRAEALAFTPDGRLLVTVTRSAASTWDVADPGHPKRVPVPAGVRRVTAATTSPDGSTLVAAGGRTCGRSPSARE